MNSLNLDDDDDGDVGRGRVSTFTASLAPSPRKVNQAVVDILRENSSCVDCGDSDSPDWCCLKFGVVFCSECCGVHRSLGTHISICRSLTLDALSDSELAMITRQGNKAMNAILEPNLENQAGWKKLAQDATREERSTYIKSKYEFLGFISDNKMSDEEKNASLEDAIEIKGLTKVHELMIHGAKPPLSATSDEQIMSLLSYYSPKT